MTAYLGPAGGLVPFRCPSAVSITTERAQSFKTTLGGRVKVQRGPVTRRQWQVELGSATPQELANLQALVEAGTPPWVWVEPYAQVTNLFTPEQSTLAPGTWSGNGATEGGAVAVADAMAPRSIMHPSGGAITLGLRFGSADRPPVRPGVPLSVSAAVRGSGVLTAHWHNWQGSAIGSATKSFSYSEMGRALLENINPPAAAQSVRVVVTGAQQVAMPCLTWTPDAPPWSMGRGCTRAVEDGLSEAVQAAVRDAPSMRRSSLSFTVREVG
ncbi:hypothetical protein HNR24_000378 [Nesterenkonia jeotgali]|uniref:Uncharacterized protein n=1 Tax=Nesterenkonia jeotgali TaxID=317018 RepID=A0A839FLY6_9MICC|nr:hypothetical protein [Nesterenkonia jeotgali]